MIMFIQRKKDCAMVSNMYNLLRLNFESDEAVFLVHLMTKWRNSVIIWIPSNE